MQSLKNVNIFGSHNHPSTCDEESLQSSYLAENIRRNCLEGTKPPQSYIFRSIYPRVRTKITQNNFRFTILNPTQRTSKSAPRFLLEKQRQERASTPVRRLPQCHLRNLQVGCQNIYQVNQNNTPLSPRVFIHYKKIHFHDDTCLSQ